VNLELIQGCRFEDAALSRGDLSEVEWRILKVLLSIEREPGKRGRGRPPEDTGGIAVIDPITKKVETTFIVPFASCDAPQGMALRPDHQMLLGCNGPGGSNYPTAIIDERSGHVIRTLNNQSGSDMVWFNPGDDHYFLARSSAVGPNQLLGVVDADGIRQDQSVPTTLTPGAPMRTRWRLTR